MMAGLYEMLFGNLPPQPQHPSSRGALLGAQYQGMPESQHIEDVRGAPEDYAANMRDAYGPPDAYAPSNLGGDLGGRSFLPSNITTRDLAFAAGADTGVYSPSFKQGWRPRPTRQAPYQSSDYGPNPNRGPAYDPAWFQGITPGMAGWRTPPSPSGPHPRTYPEGQGPQPPIFSDPSGEVIGARGLTLNSVPQ